MSDSIDPDRFVPSDASAHGERMPEYERVLAVRHWTEHYFSFTTTRDAGLRFDNGQFVMIGLDVDGKLVRRAYSIASANWDESLEFFSIKVEHGALTSRLKSIQPGDLVWVGRKPTGTLLIADLHPGRNLYLLATGTGLAPFLAIIRDPDTYARFERVVLVHGVRRADDLAYRDYIERELPRHEYLGELIREKFHYSPWVSREAFQFRGNDHHGRITDALARDAIAQNAGLDALDPARDRAMICGSPAMLADLRRALDARGISAAPRIGVAGDYVFERAFVEK